MKLWGATLALLLLSHTAASAVIEHEYESSAFSETRKILVSLPVDYESDPSRRFPVLYVLNGSENFEWTAGIAEFLAEREEIDELVVVGLPSDEMYGRDNYPFTGPEASERNEWAVRHEAFIRQEAIPFVDQSLRTNGSRYIAGHSLSGLFVTSLFLNDPDGFNVHLAISPSYHQAPGILAIMQDALASGEVAAGALYLAVGDLEHSQMRGNVDEMVETLRTHAPNGLRWTYSVIQHNNHRTTAGTGLSDGLSWMYRDWDPTEEMATNWSFDRIMAHYDSLARFLGYRLTPREGNTLGLAGFLLRRLDDPSAALTIYRVARHFYPDSDAADHMIALLEPWLAGGAQAVRDSLENGADIQEPAVLDLINVLRNHAHDDRAADMQRIANDFFPGQ